MKKVRSAVIIILCVVAVLGGYSFLSAKNKVTEENVELTEVQEVITKEVEKNYPTTPREVVKLYNRIITCFYNEKYTDDELYALGDKARLLFDEELLENNPRDTYFADLKTDIAEYQKIGKTIVSSAVDGSNDVVYKKVDGDECAYVEASYFLKEKTGYSRTYQMYVLRKDADGNWKILGFYLVDGKTSNDE